MYEERSSENHLDVGADTNLNPRIIVLFSGRGKLHAVSTSALPFILGSEVGELEKPGILANLRRRRKLRSSSKRARSAHDCAQQPDNPQQQLRQLGPAREKYQA